MAIPLYTVFRNFTDFSKFGQKMVKKGPKRGVFGKNQEYLPYELELVCFFGLLLILTLKGAVVKPRSGLKSRSVYSDWNLSER